MSPFRKIYNKFFYTFHHIGIHKNYKKFKNLIKNFKENKIKILKWTKDLFDLKYNQKLLNTL